VIRKMPPSGAAFALPTEVVSIPACGGLATASAYARYSRSTT
jgi:hypothetical protein